MCIAKIHCFAHLVSLLHEEDHKHHYIISILIGNGGVSIWGKKSRDGPPPPKKNPKQTQEFIRLTGILALREILIPAITENVQRNKVTKLDMGKLL